MGATVQGILLTGDHASRPSSGLEYGTIYACTTHLAIEQTSDTGSTWATWPQLMGTAPAPTTIELGHASDTTIARASAGNLTVEGNALYRAGGTDVALADGGTGASLTDPNADRIMFWDDSAGAIAWLAAGSGLSISGTTITASGGAGGSPLEYVLGADVALTTANTFYDGPSGTPAAGTYDIHALIECQANNADPDSFVIRLVKGSTVIDEREMGVAPGSTNTQGQVGALMALGVTFDGSTAIKITAASLRGAGTMKRNPSRGSSGLHRSTIIGLRKV